MNNRIRTLTINTWKCDGDYFPRMRVLSDQLKIQNCDVIVCQECFKTEDNQINTIEFLSNKLEMNSIFTAAREKIRRVNGTDVKSFSGLGILSGLPLYLLEEIDLPSNHADGGRKAQLAEIQIDNGQKLLIANVHLAFRKSDSKLRKIQLMEISDKLLLQSNYDYILICGDFNAEMNSPEIEYFKKYTNAADCYTSGNGAKLNSGKFNDFQVSRRIDHIFSLPVNGDNHSAKFCNSNIVLNTPDPQTGLYPSDHFGVLTELVVEKN